MYKRQIARCASEGVRTLAVGGDLESLDAVRALGTPTVYGLSLIHISEPTRPY